MKPDNCFLTIIVISTLCAPNSVDSLQENPVKISKPSENPVPSNKVNTTESPGSKNKSYSVNTKATEDLCQSLSNQTFQPNTSMVGKSFSPGAKTYRTSFTDRRPARSSEGTRNRRAEDVEFRNQPTPEWARITPPGENPYVVLLRRCDGKIDEHCRAILSSCSGSLITLKWVLTSATCVSNRYYSYMEIYAGGFSSTEIIPGVINKQENPPSGVQFRVAKRGNLHGWGYYPKKFYKFDSNSDENPDKSPFGYYDVGLVRPTKAFNRTSVVQPIGISNKPWRYANSYIHCKVTGFSDVGQGHEEFAYNHFERATYDVWVTSPCLNGKLCQMWKFDAPGSAMMRMCGEPVNGDGVCENVAGASLICGGQIHGVFTQGIAVNTWFYSKDMPVCEKNVYSDVRCGFDNYTSLFTDICFALRWINRKTKIMSAENVPTSCDVEEETKQLMQESRTKSCGYSSLPSCFLVFSFCLYKLHQLA